jgi:tetratricopeptide (TPR) repeat protein
MSRVARIVITFAVVVVSATLVLTAAPRAQDPPRPMPFEYLVRADFFAGLRGDVARLDRAMKICEDTLATTPGHPDALVWHGAGLVIRSGQAFAQGDPEMGTERFRRGLAEMDQALRLAPDALSVIVVRAATINAAAENVRDRAQARTLLASAVDGFERALAVQAPVFDRMSEHARGELLAGLAQGWSRLGQPDKARGYLERIVAELPDTRYQARARAWLEDGPGSGPLTCLTCHRQ